MDDLIVVGAGWAGLTATAFALGKGAKVRLIAQGIGSVIVTPGWISVWDSATGSLEESLIHLAQQVPDHPYALAGIDALKNALAEFDQLAGDSGLNLCYIRDTDFRTNFTVLTALGAAQHPFSAPLGYVGSGQQSPLFVGFEGWRDYYPALSGPHSATISLPALDRPWDATPTDLARAFDNAEFRAVVATRVKPHLNGATSAGFPAVLGLENPVAAIEDLSERLGVPVFEIPTLPPSVPGTRLYNKLRRYFLDRGVRMQVGHPVVRGLVENGHAMGVEVAAAGKPQRFYAKRIILATGGLYGGGLFSDDHGRIWEPLFDIPVQYDPDRSRWFNENLLDPRGHPVHHFGVRANHDMQPLNADGTPVAEGLYVAGHLLTHPQVEGAPPPFETAEGVALATAYRAVTCALQGLA
jgi:glycerol-3-phosphate dehydrogenase subunit B